MIGGGALRGRARSRPRSPSARDAFQLTVPMINPPAEFTAFRLELVDGSKTSWTSPALARPGDDTFRIVVPRAFLAPGKYQVVVYGVNDARQERLASYSLRVTAR